MKSSVFEYEKHSLGMYSMEGSNGEKKMFSNTAGSVWVYSYSLQCEGNHCPHNFGFISPFLTLKGNIHRQHMARVKTPASTSGILTHQHIPLSYFPTPTRSNSPKLYHISYLDWHIPATVHCAEVRDYVKFGLFERSSV